MILEGPSAIRAVEAVEALRAFVLTDHPSLADRIDRTARLPWDTIPAGERGTLAIAAHLGLDPDIPPQRRHARHLALAIRNDDGMPSTEPSPDGALPVPAIASLPRLKRSLEWICSDAFVRDLKSAAGPSASIRLVARKAPALRALQGSRFLVLLGIPAIVLDGARLTWLRRMGWIGAEEPSGRRAREEALRVLGAVSVQGGIPLWELDRLTAAFTGAERPATAAACCTRRPGCARCPVRASCAYGIAQSLQPGGVRESSRESRRLREAMPSEDLPREKLLRRGPEALTDSELLAILIRTGNGRQHAVELAGSILANAESLDRLGHMSVTQMTGLPGLGTVKAVTIKAALELARRLRGDGAGESAQPFLKSARAVYEYLRPHYVQRRKELFVAVLLDTKIRVMRRVVISEGTLNQSLVHPREAFQEALRDSAHSIIFAHNHPSGDPAPSRDDRLVTARLVKAGEVLGIQVRDHIIMGEGTYYSFADEGLIQQGA